MCLLESPASLDTDYKAEELLTKSEKKLHQEEALPATAEIAEKPQFEKLPQ